ncbi:MAG: type II toxin-antitoxin system VapC family toxin [Candidatus Brockarchaeota archaeon]|nr:type II toxin-antitoxin system VapC family toxin [Candidatus Brockarchaeota archaeon]
MTGIDTSILVYSLDPTFPEHGAAKRAVLSLEGWFVNPTVIHESYHTLVYKRRMGRMDAKAKLEGFLSDKRTSFLSQTKAVTSFSLDLAAAYDLGGRDSLIISCYLYNRIGRMITHDDKILKRMSLSFRGKSIRFEDPLR